MNRISQDLMREAARLTLAGQLDQASRVIRRALSDAGTAGAEPRPAADDGMVLDGCVFEVTDPAPASPSALAPAAPPTASSEVPLQRPTPSAAPPAPPWVQPACEPDASRSGPGEFRSGRHSHAARTLDYKLYVPPGHAGRTLPLVVMLHGCTQDPDDFARGTGMNERAREQGFFVLYPAQSQSANPSRCWNWFKHSHQQRGRGEPAAIASLTQAVMTQHGIDPRRVYIAGLSAGGAMAAILAEAYPEIFAAVGVHSGLPSGAASGVPEALRVMKTGAAGTALPGQPGQRGSRPARPSSAAARRPVPTIVFHGDQDQTVHPRNGEEVIAAALGGAAEEAFGRGNPEIERGVSARGRRYTRFIHPGDRGRPAAEHWLVHGAGHAWSGGHAGGSYTDAQGPDATREMLRFFFERPHGAMH